MGANPPRKGGARIYKLQAAHPFRRLVPSRGKTWLFVGLNKAPTGKMKINFFHIGLHLDRSPEPQRRFPLVEKGHDSVGGRVGSEICHGKWTAGWKVAGSNEFFGLEEEGILSDLFGFDKPLFRTFADRNLEQMPGRLLKMGFMWSASRIPRI